MTGSEVLREMNERRVLAGALLYACAGLTKVDALAALKADAERAHASYPQYAGYWDSHFLGRVKRTVRTKMGVAFEKGDLALVGEYEAPESIEGLKVSCFSCYSNRNGCETVLRKKDVEVL